jgi:hypothetical protein
VEIAMRRSATGEEQLFICAAGLSEEKPSPWWCRIYRTAGQGTADGIRDEMNRLVAADDGIRRVGGHA